MKRYILILCGAACAAMACAQGTRMTLEQCIEHALSRNVQVQQADVSARKQGVALSTARNARLPELSAGAGENVAFGRGLTLNNTYSSQNTHSTAFNVSASLPLFTGFRVPNERKQAELNLEAALADVARLRDDLSIQVTQAYLQALYQQDMMAQAEQQLALSRTQERRIDSLIVAGKSAGIEKSEAHSRTAQDELALVQARNNYRLALLDLAQLIELPSPDSLEVVPVGEVAQSSVGTSGGAEPASGHPAVATRTFPLPDDVYAVAVEEKPVMRVQDLRIKSAEKAIDVARAGYWPTLSLNVGLGTSYYHTSGYSNSAFGRQLKDNFSKTIGLSLSIPVFDAFRTRNSIRQARLDYESQKLEQENTRKTLYKEIQQAYYNAVAAQQKYKSAVVAEGAAQDAFVLMARKYENGRANATEYDEARTKQLTAAYERIAAYYEFVFRSKILDFYQGQPL